MTHWDTTTSFVTRIAWVCFMLAVGWVLQQLYFTETALTRPKSGAHVIDKWFHIAITHFCNILYFWEVGFEKKKEKRGKHSDSVFVMNSMCLRQMRELCVGGHKRDARGT